MLIQKARLKWINDGDNNSRLFHRVVKGWSRHNHIDSIYSGNGILDSICKVKKEVVDNFSSKFVKDDVDRPVLYGTLFKSLNSLESASLEVLFLESEIKEVVWGFEGSKSMGPDGFSLFIWRCWYFL